jgi:hypothetical protein
MVTIDVDLLSSPQFMQSRTVVDKHGSNMPQSNAIEGLKMVSRQVCSEQVLQSETVAPHEIIIVGYGAVSISNSTAQDMLEKLLEIAIGAASQWLSTSPHA